MKYVIATHGGLAEGYISSIRLLLGTENVYALNAYLENAPDFIEEFAGFMERNKGEKVVVFTDLANGSVTQAIIRLRKQYIFTLFSGVNLPLVMEILLMEEELSEEGIEDALRVAREQIVCIQ